MDFIVTSLFQKTQFQQAETPVFSRHDPDYAFASCVCFSCGFCPHKNIYTIIFIVLRSFDKVK